VRRRGERRSGDETEWGKRGLRDGKGRKGAEKGHLLILAYTT